jgi:hypothetical protein
MSIALTQEASKMSINVSSAMNSCEDWQVRTPRTRTLRSIATWGNCGESISPHRTLEHVAGVVRPYVLLPMINHNLRLHSPRMQSQPHFTPSCPHRRVARRLTRHLYSVDTVRRPLDEGSIYGGGCTRFRSPLSRSRIVLCEPNRAGPTNYAQGTN